MCKCVSTSVVSKFVLWRIWGHCGLGPISGTHSEWCMMSTYSLVGECCQVQLPAMGRVLCLCWRLPLELFRSQARVPQLLESRIWGQQLWQVPPQCLNLVSNHRVRPLAGEDSPLSNINKIKGMSERVVREDTKSSFVFDCSTRVVLSESSVVE